jgi:glycosyltransferase involved in cell wall biosynthesis
MHVVLIEFRDSTPHPVQLANALGHLCRVTLMLSDSATGLASKVDRTKVGLQLFHMPRHRAPTNLAMVLRIHRQLRVLRPDVVHITCWHLWGTPGLGPLKRFPLVATVHDVSRHPGDGWAYPSVLYPLQWRWADQVIVHANAARQQLLSQHGCKPDRVHAIPIGAYDFYRDWLQSDAVERPNTVLFFGRIWEYKGLEYLIAAEPLITRAIPDARIIIAGQGDSFERYQKTMVNPHNFEVHNHHIPNEMVAELFQKASVVVLPYIEASQSGVIPVAYAFGKPVVATNVGGIPDVVDHGETGYLVPPRDKVRLAEAVITLLKDRQLRENMGCKALEKAQTQMSWSNIAAQTLEVYHQALDGSPKGWNRQRVNGSADSR